MPAHRLKALLNEISDSQPTSLAITDSARVESARMPAAARIRRAVTYSITREPQVAQGVTEKVHGWNDRSGNRSSRAFTIRAALD